MFAESSDMQNTISRLSSAYIASHMILLALTTVDILCLVILSRSTFSNHVHMSTYSVAMIAKGRRMYLKKSDWGSKCQLGHLTVQNNEKIC